MSVLKTSLLLCILRLIKQGQFLGQPVGIKSLSFSSDSVILILSQTNFEAIPSKDVGGVALLAKADMLHKILNLTRLNLNVSHEG